MQSIKTKICGITTGEIAQLAAAQGVDYLGFVSFPKSPRHLSLNAAKKLGPQLPNGPARVGVFVDATAGRIAKFTEALGLTHVQLHGKEMPMETEMIKEMTGLQVIKAITLSEPKDLMKLKPYVEVTDYLMFDAKPPEGSALPGGNNVSLPWEILHGIKFSKPWFLAGGINAGNVGTAIKQSGAKMVDISSSVESTPGVKCPLKIKEFMAAIKAL